MATVGRIRNTHRDGWIELDKRASPQRWIARWTTGESYTDARGRTKYRCGRHFLGYKTAKDLATLAAAKQKWASIKDQVLYNRKPQIKDLDVNIPALLRKRVHPLAEIGLEFRDDGQDGVLFRISLPGCR